ncbi:hypothetical protein Hanom_Chr05g00403701 [Helianthus anomalus]
MHMVQVIRGMNYWFYRRIKLWSAPPHPLPLFCLLFKSFEHCAWRWDAVKS